MMRPCLLLLVGLVLVFPAAAQEAGPAKQAERPGVRFESVAVYVDSGGAPLAAYQFEFVADPERVKIVGIEGGEHAAFRRPPYYDPAALMHNRAIIAAFSTARDLPRGRTRVSRLHLQVTGEERPDYAVKLSVAASADGERMPAEVSLGQGGEP
jgi:hypothetical protein